MNRTSHPDWVKIFDDPNGQIKLHAKQKYKVISATHISKTSLRNQNHKMVFIKKKKKKWRGYPRSVIVKTLDGEIVVSQFEP